MTFLVSFLLTLLPLVLAGYARSRSPLDNAGLWLFGVAVVSGWMTAGVREGWWGLLLPQLFLVTPSVIWWVRRERRRRTEGDARTSPA